MRDLYVGQDVVCIDDKVPIMGGAFVKDAAITEGQVYRLRWVGMATHYVFGDYLGVKLVGVDSKFGEAWGEKDAPFAARRFRPLVKDRLGSLRAILAGNDPAPAPDEPKQPVRVKEEETV